MAVKHLPGNLRIPGFIGSYQSEAISAEDRNQSVEQEKRSENKEAGRLQRVVQGRKPSLQSGQTSAWPMEYSRRSHHCFVFSHRFCQAGTTTKRELQQAQAIRFSLQARI
jgi:hypothetical protein